WHGRFGIPSIWISDQGTHFKNELLVLPLSSPLEFCVDAEPKKKYSRKANFSVGDYVLRSRVDQKHQDQLLVTWIGPHQIVRADVHSFVARYLVTGAETDVHASRLKYYADKNYKVTEDVREHVASQGVVLAVSKLWEHRWCSAKKSYEVLVSWKGLESIEDSWEPL
ncbi:Hypothetical protein PHPALM_8875, partial [Phytophthora palmivora]